MAERVNAKKKVLRPNHSGWGELSFLAVSGGRVRGGGDGRAADREIKKLVKQPSGEPVV